MSVCRSLNFFYYFVVLSVALFSLWVVPLFMAFAPLPRLVFGRGFPVPAAAARPAPRMALRPAQPRAAAGFSLSSGGLRAGGVFLAMSDFFRIFAADFKANTHEKQKPLPNNRESQSHIG